MSRHHRDGNVKKIPTNNDGDPPQIRIGNNNCFKFQHTSQKLRKYASFIYALSYKQCISPLSQIPAGEASRHELNNSSRSS